MYLQMHWHLDALKSQGRELIWLERSGAVSTQTGWGALRHICFTCFEVWECYELKHTNYLLMSEGGN